MIDFLTNQCNALAITVFKMDEGLSKLRDFNEAHGSELLAMARAQITGWITENGVCQVCHARVHAEWASYTDAPQSILDHGLQHLRELHAKELSL